MTAGKRQAVTRQQFLAFAQASRLRDQYRVEIVGLRRALDIRLRPWAFRPHIGLLPLRYIAGGDVGNRRESGPGAASDR